MFKVEVIAGHLNEDWCSNQLTFDTVEDAAEYGRDLFYRWTAVRKWRVVDTETTEVQYSEG